jgi:hypothetical protein
MALRNAVSFRPGDLGTLPFAIFASSLVGACGSTNNASTVADAGDVAAVADAGHAGPASDDASPEGSVPDATACATISASSNDQTCANDADCVTIAEGDACMACGLSCATATRRHRKTRSRDGSGTDPSLTASCLCVFLFLILA